MLEFKSEKREKQFQVSFAKQHLTWDLSVCLVGWLQYIPVMVNLWRNRRIRSRLWHAAFIALYTAEKLVPTTMITLWSGVYAHRRTTFVCLARLVEMFTTDAYLSFWMDFSNKGSCSEWSLLAFVFANNWLSAAHWGFLQPLPNQCWLAVQVMDMIRIFLRHSTSLRQLEGGLHHLTPLTGAVNSLTATFGISAVSERDLLSCSWLLLEVFGGFVVPLWLTYKMQLRSRRQWRQGIIKRRADIPGSSHWEEDKDPGLRIRPTWTLFLPESLTFLMLSFVAGQNFELLYHMV